MSERNKQVVLEFIAAMSDGDAERADKVLAPVSTATAKGFAKVSGTRDRATSLGTMAAFKEMVPTGFRPTIMSVIAGDDKVAVEFEGNAVLSNGKPYCNQYCMVFTLKDGLITNNNEYFCTLLADSAIGPLLEERALTVA